MVQVTSTRSLEYGPSLYCTALQYSTQVHRELCTILPVVYDSPWTMFRVFMNYEHSRTSGKQNIVLRSSRLLGVASLQYSKQSKLECHLLAMYDIQHDSWQQDSKVCQHFNTDQRSNYIWQTSFGGAVTIRYAYKLHGARVVTCFPRRWLE